MTAEDDRDLFLLLCRGLLEANCSRVDFDGSRFGVTASLAVSLAPSGASGPVMVLGFSELEFLTAVARADVWAASLWPDRPPRRRAVQLMLVHADEQIATVSGPAAACTMTLWAGDVVVRPAPPATDAEAMSEWADAAAAEEARMARTIDEGRKRGQTFEWR